MRKSARLFVDRHPSPTLENVVPSVQKRGRASFDDGEGSVGCQLLAAPPIQSFKYIPATTVTTLSNDNT
jgi:hypothetical protein